MWVLVGSPRLLVPHEDQLCFQGFLIKKELGQNHKKGALVMRVGDVGLLRQTEMERFHQHYTQHCSVEY